MSGSFKGVTMTAEDIASDGCIKKVRSMIKVWKDLEGRIFLDTKPEDHRNFALLHLSLLQNMMDEVRLHRDPEIKFYPADINIERGVSDPFYYYLRGKIYGRDTEEIIERAVDEEMRIVDYFGDIKKILLVNKDREFIKNVVLLEPHRSQVFPGGVDDYLKQQDDYISFTARYNKITEVREIDNARDYIERLGLKYIENL